MKEQFDEGAQSSVRLCVVAPTVNVTFGEQTLSYKAPLPKERIRNTLELQVLPNFAKSFIQQRENVSPDGGTIDEWLKEVTGTMQGSIETPCSKCLHFEAQQQEMESLRQQLQTLRSELARAVGMPPFTPLHPLHPLPLRCVCTCS